MGVSAGVGEQSGWEVNLTANGEMMQLWNFFEPTCLLVLEVPKFCTKAPQGTAASGTCMLDATLITSLR